MNLENQLQQALKLQQSGQLKQADLLYQKIAQQDIMPGLAKHQWCVLKIRLEQYPEALELIQQLLNAAPDNPEYLVSKAKILENLQQHDDAQAIYLGLINQAEPYLPAYTHMGNLYFHKNQVSQAISLYQQALRYNQHPEIRFNYALALAKNEQLDCAQQQLKQVIQEQPKHYKAQFQIAEIYRAQQQWSLAITHYQTLLQDIPGHIDANIGIALCYHASGEHQSAIEHLTPFIDPEQPLLEAHELLATIYTQQQQQQKALKHLQTCFSLHKSPIYLYNIGNIYMQQQRHQEAIMYFKEVLKLDSSHLDTLLNLGSIYLGMRDKDAAIHAYQSALKINPDNPEIMHILSALKKDRIPEKPPNVFVENLFNSYASRYDQHLTKFLKYNVPQQILEMLNHANVLQPSNMQITDVGCGTGLSGAVLKPYAQHLIGIDLAADMLKLAEEKQIYDQLITGELCHALTHLPHQDLIVAADVLTYLGDLKPVFAAVHTNLVPGGHFVFSVERDNTQASFVLRDSLRYAHNIKYIEQLAAQYHFNIINSENTVIRQDHGRDIEGYLLLLQSVAP